MLHLRFNQISILILILLASASCSTPKDITYFQDLKNNRIYTVPTQTIKIKPADKLSIIVNSRDAQLTEMFNLPYAPRNLGSSLTGSSRGTNQGVSVYTVSPDGFIDFPLLGQVQVEGMTRLEIAALIKGMLISKDLDHPRRHRSRRRSDNLRKTPGSQSGPQLRRPAGDLYRQPP